MTNNKKGKEVLFGTDTRAKLKVGVDTVAKAVGVTMGAGGRTVSIKDDYRRNHPTKDGYTVARHIELEDPIEDMGASMIIDAAKKAVDEAGDGTSTCTVLTQAIFEGGLKNIAAGANVIDIRTGINEAVKQIKSYLDGISEDVGESVDKIRSIATISANNDREIGNLIANAIEKVGLQTVISAEESKNSETYVDVVEGLEFNQGFLSPYFITNLTKMSVEFDNPLILLLDGKISTIQAIMSILEYAIDNNRSLVIISNEISGEVLQSLVLNKRQGKIQVACVRAPYLNDKRREFLDDIATLTGATLVSDNSGVGFESFDETMFGSSKRIVIKRESTAIIDGAGLKKDVKDRAKALKARLKESKDPRDKKFLKSRIAKLSGGVGVMYVGANTELELREKMDRVDDALHATRAAIEEGIVSGGGTTLLRASKFLDYDVAENEDEVVGMKIVAEAIKKPFYQIVTNAGKGVPEVIMDRIFGNIKEDLGYDVKKGEYVNMKESGIIDPKKVTRVALESAASVAVLLLTTECTITDKENL